MADVMDYLRAGAPLGATLTVSVAAHELVDLHHKLRTQPVIEEAKGILMGHYGVNADAAFSVLRRWSQNHNVKLCSIAEILIDGVGQQPVSQRSPHMLIEQTFAADTKAGGATTPGSP